MVALKWPIGGVCAITITWFICGACAMEPPPVKKMTNDDIETGYQALEQSAQSNVTVSYWGASTPIKQFLLIRNGKDVCAVRFTEFHLGRDARPPTVFHSGDETLYAEYDWYYQEDGSGDFTKPNVVSGHSKLERGAMVGIGRFSFQTGSTVVACGPFKLGWIYPNNVGFHLSNSKKDDVGNELSPTKWKDIREVNVHDSRLKWYRFDEERKTISIPVDELWGKE